VFYNKIGNGMPELWNEEILKSFINDGIEENLNLDYKAADALAKTDLKKKEISKDVSALANSDGGIIIYGIAEYNAPDKSHLPEKIVPVSRKDFSKEWLEQIINTNIFPRISNIKITPVKINNSDNEVIYVVDVPKSNTAHQANDKRYYKRFNFESIAMYDYEIRDILNRAHTPILKLEFVIKQESYEYSPSNFLLGVPSRNEKSQKKIITDTDLIIYAYNEGKILANYVNCFIDLPESILGLDSKNDKKLKKINNIVYVEYYCSNTIRELTGFSGSDKYRLPTYGPSHYDPILPKTKKILKEIRINSDLKHNGLKFFYALHSDNSEPIMGEAKFSDIKIIRTKRNTK
jgi:hypothetical protein